MGKYNEVITSFNEKEDKYPLNNYSGYISESGIKILYPVGKNYKNQFLWKCQCGYCGNEFVELPARIRNNHTKSCGCLKTKFTHMRNMNIKYSFKQWCINNNHKDYLNLWDYEKNGFNPDNISYLSDKKVWFKCLNKVNDHTSEQKYICHIVNRGFGTCNQCNSFAYNGEQIYGKSFLQDYWDYNKNEKDPHKISKCSKNKVWIKCQNASYHESYQISCDKFFIDNNRCPLCNRQSGKVHKKDSIGELYPDVLKIWSDKNKNTPYDYAPQSTQKVWLKCENGKHDDYQRIVNNYINRKCGCPKCVQELNSSILQSKVKEYIIQKYPDTTILNEYDCNITPYNFITKRKMPFDNELVEQNLIIEIHGEQHYNKNNFYNKLQSQKNGMSLDESFNTRKMYDSYKRSYAISHGYNYLVIPYWSMKNNLYQILIDNKLKNT